LTRSNIFVLRHTSGSSRWIFQLGAHFYAQAEIYFDFKEFNQKKNAFPFAPELKY